MVQDRRSQLKEHCEYLKDCLNTRQINQVSYILSLHVIQELILEDCEIIPAAATGPDQEMFYGWDVDAHHLEAEIMPNGVVEFFYRNRRTGETWFQEVERFEKLPREFITYMKGMHDSHHSHKQQSSGADHNPQ